MDVEVEVDWEVPEVPEPAEFGDQLHSPDKFLKVTSAEATAVDIIDRGGTRVSRLFQAQVIRRGSGPNRVVDHPFWAVVQWKEGVQPWVVSVVPFVQVRPPYTHNRLLLCSIDALGQLQRWKQCVERRAGHCPCPPLEGGSAGVSPPLPEAAPGERAEGGEGGQGRIRRVWGPVPAEQGPHGAAGQGLQAPSPHDHPPGGSTGSGGSARLGGGGGWRERRWRFSAWRRRTSC